MNRSRSARTVALKSIASSSQPASSSKAPAFIRPRPARNPARTAPPRLLRRPPLAPMATPAPKIPLPNLTLQPQRLLLHHPHRPPILAPRRARAKIQAKTRESDPPARDLG